LLAFTTETAAPHWLLPLLLWEGSFQRMIFLLSRVNFAHVLVAWEFSQDPRELSVNFSFQHHSYTSVSGCGTLIVRFNRLALDLYFFF